MKKIPKHIRQELIKDYQTLLRERTSNKLDKSISEAKTK